MTDFSDKQRVEIAKQQYAEYEVGSVVTIENETIKIGYVAEVIHHHETGKHAYILTSEKLSSNAKESEIAGVADVTVLFRSSEEPFGGTSWESEWFEDEDTTSGRAQDRNSNKLMRQLRSASQTLKTVMERYHNAQFDIYGHSLGSMNGQYAISDSFYPERIRSAFLYEGQNTYPFLNERQQLTADRLRRRIYNYIDEHDLVAIGYGDGKAVGIVIRIHSKKVGIAQHMWGGYQFDYNGNIIAPTTIRLEVKMAQTEGGIVEKLNRLALGVSKFQTNSRKISTSEELYINSSEALIILEGIARLVEVGFLEIINLYTEAILEVEAHWAETKKVAQLFGSSLSEDEVMMALAEGGATKTSMVDIPIIYFEMMIAKAKTIQGKYEKLIVHIKSIINEIEDVDQSLSEELRG